MAEVKTIRALARGLEVLEYLSMNHSATLNEFHQETGLPKATLLRILLTLEDNGWIYRSLGDGHYRLSTKGPMMNPISSAENALIEHAAPVLLGLCHRVGWPSDLAIRNGAKMRIIDSTRRKSPLSVNKDVVGFCPHMLRSALGRAYLAFCPRDERQQILNMLKASKESFDLVSQDDVWVDHLLDDSRSRGYAVREAGYWGHIVDYPSNVDAIALPVLVREQVICCLSIAWNTGAVTKQQVDEELFPALASATQEFSDVLQWGPESFK